MEAAERKSLALLIETAGLHGVLKAFACHFLGWLKGFSYGTIFAFPLNVWSFFLRDY